MTRVLLMLLCGSLLSACSVSDVRQMAEGVRIQAEGIGAQASIKRQNALMDTAANGEYGSIRVQQEPEPEADVEAQKAAEAEKAKAPAAPPPPTYVVIPAY